jgi:hypothetical protein
MPSTLWQVLRKTGQPLSLLPWSRHRWPVGPTTSAMSGSRGGSMPVLLARRWPTGPVTVSRCSTGFTRTASTVTMNGGTSRWRSSLASLESASARRSALISRAELAPRRKSHSAFIPGLVTLSGFWRHMAAQPFNWRLIVFAAQDGSRLVRVGAPSRIRTCAHGPEGRLDLIL